MTQRATFFMMLRRALGIRGAPSITEASHSQEFYTATEMSTRGSFKRGGSTEGANSSGRMGQFTKDSTNGTRNTEGGR